MTRSFAFLVASLLFLFSTPSFAEDCNTDCHRQCRIRTDIPPIDFVEPTCHLKCEAAKKASCVVGSPIPTIPITPLEQTKEISQAACGAIYTGITQGVIAQCSNLDNRLDGQSQISQAVDLLVKAGLFTSDEFNGVQIRQCGTFSGEGIAPESGRIYLKPASINGHPVDLASLIGHEMTHIRQHRSRIGSSEFACDYSRAMAECGGCQDSNNRMEREAYDWQNQNLAKIQQVFFQSSPPNSLPPNLPLPLGSPPPQVPVVNSCFVGYYQGAPQGCFLPGYQPVGTQCSCIYPTGQFFGVAQ